MFNVNRCAIYICSFLMHESMGWWERQLNYWMYADVKCTEVFKVAGSSLSLQ